MPLCKLSLRTRHAETDQPSTLAFEILSRGCSISTVRRKKGLRLLPTMCSRSDDLRGTNPISTYAICVHIVSRVVRHGRGMIPQRSKQRTKVCCAIPPRNPQRGSATSPARAHAHAPIHKGQTKPAELRAKVRSPEPTKYPNINRTLTPPVSVPKDLHPESPSPSAAFAKGGPPAPPPWRLRSVGNLRLDSACTHDLRPSCASSKAEREYTTDVTD
eukprot:1179456-Prorocentrum_minimum.AAC.4